MYFFALVLPLLYYLYVLFTYICKVGRRNNMWPFSKTFHSDIQLHGVTVVITGGNAGIGKETVKDLYKRGARVLILCRDQEKGKATIEELKRDIETEHGELIMKSLDLSSLASVRACAMEVIKEEQKIDYLINNAGFFCNPVRWTTDGYESHFGVNYLGHFLLTILLLPTIIKSGPARIVNVSSYIHKFYYLFGAKIYFKDLNLTRNFNQVRAYSQSKLAQVMFTRELAKRLQALQINNVTTYSLHPGVVGTNLGQHFDEFIPGTSWLWNNLSRWLTISPTQGAQTTLYCALDKNVTSKTGGYFEDCSESNPASTALDEGQCAKLWDVSMELLKLQDPLEKNY